MKKEEEKKPHVKKPLNAFMLYMKEMRAKVVAECTLKESAAINQILGRKVRRALTPRLHGRRPLRSSLPVSPTVAQPVPRRTGQVLRTGPEGAAAALAALPDLVSPGQLRKCPLRPQGSTCRGRGRKTWTTCTEDPSGPREVFISLAVRKAFAYWHLHITPP